MTKNLINSPESNVNNIINYLSMQHITTTSLNTINTVKNSLTSHLNQNIYDNNIINNSLNSNKISANLHGTKSNEIDRVIISDDKNRSQPCLRKQQSPSKIQRLKHNYPFRPFTMSRDSDDVLVNSNNSSQHLNHSTYKKFSSSTITISTKKSITLKSSPCVCNDNIRKRVKSNSIHHCPILPSTISLTSLVNDSSSKDSSITSDMIIPESRESHDHPSKIKARNSMDDQTEFDIRRSWSHIEVRHLKGLFSRRNRHSSDVQRRNSYAYTNSQRANRQVATESEFKTFMDPCINASTSPPLVNKDDIRIIFAHLDDLIKLSDKFVETIETSMDPYEVYDSKLGQVFLDFAEGFEVYKKYAENIQRSRQLLTKKVNQSAQRKKENIRLGLSDYLIMPIQRVARYSLLLKDLKKYTIETHFDYNDLCKALDYMVSLAKECNNNIQDI
ncbi:14896_t:CDS:2 [Rhizophagus irregularis]|nr:14896_t:CDS:2 [Rhizophagus irregularis]